MRAYLTILDFGEVGNDFRILQAQTQALPNVDELVGGTVKASFFGHAEGQSGVDAHFKVPAFFDGDAEGRKHVVEPN